ncbi:nucleotidyltransferase [Salinibacterium sp. M195]|uniref:nucleotidyltransferase domain-containing protein n=1 Tax=Salinibacterium sp. M195 TaxID=2583374 RepID=UPI001C62F2B2|nr:nucleotidyltransferase [Salinibacterium sp. M195]QYH36945.1 nucleotidyltransferase [Salinibacterium sp. M195]
MARLNPQFANALTLIEPGDDKINAPEAHKLVRAALAADSRLTSYGIDSILIGSYKRRVSIRRVKDVDVFCRLDSLPSGVSSTQILDIFFEVLNAEFGKDEDGHRRVTRQSRSLKIAFPNFDLDVDAVPARRSASGEVWEIPQKGSDDEWVETNPEVMSQVTIAMNDEHNDFYVPTVKLLRQTRRSLLNKAKPGGFFIEAATYQAFASGAVGGKTQADYFVSALVVVSELITDFVQNGIAIVDATRAGKTIGIRADDEELTHLDREFAAAAVKGVNALKEEHEGKAALLYRELLGKNGDGDIVFSMPPGFRDDGTRSESTVTAGDPDVPAGSKTFG